MNLVNALKDRNNDLKSLTKKHEKNENSVLSININKSRAKTTFKSFAYNHLGFDVKQFITDSKSIKTLQKLSYINALF